MTFVPTIMTFAIYFANIVFWVIYDTAPWYCSNYYSLEQYQIWAQDNNTFRLIWKKLRQKWLVKNSKFVWRKKNPTRVQIFRYFRIESRNNYSFEITGNKCTTVRGKNIGINLNCFCCKCDASNVQVTNFCESGIIFEKRPLNKKYLTIKSKLEIYYGKASS